MCHKLLKYEPRYDLKCTWNSDFRSVLYENEAKQNWYEFPCAGSLIICLEDFEKMTGF